MHRFILWWGIINFVVLLFPFKTFASDVVINEIFANPEDENDEFIELYNNTNSEIDLNNWKISDLVKDFAITDQKISGKGFLVLEKSTTGLALNNSNEQVSLLASDQNIVDTFSYESTIEGKSWSRSPDGTGSFSNNTDITKGSHNAVPPTSTPTITPTPTSTPKPTKQPTPTTLSTVKTALNDKAESSKDDEEEVGGESLPSNSKINLISTPVNSQEVKSSTDENVDQSRINNEEEESPPDYLYSLTTGLGMLGLAFGIIAYKKFKKKNEEDDF